MIDIKTDFSDIQKKLEELTSNNGTTFWHKIATAIFSKIIRNIQVGRDVDGNPFKGYTASYKKFKAKNGLSLVVNLQYKSEMIRAITMSADERGFAIYVSGAFNNKKAEWNQINNGRKFLAWGKDTYQVFIDTIRKEMEIL